MRTFLLVLLALAAGGALAGCGALPRSATPRGVRVVAAENFWGSIAGQLGGIHADVRSIITSPAQDPHSYEPTAADARGLAIAQLAIFNGAGYDPWAAKLLAAEPVDGRRQLSVGKLLGLVPGDNPHRWYDPADVGRVAGAITASLAALDPRHSAYYRRRLRWFQTTALGPYHRLITLIRRRYAGVPVGASESIFALLSPALGLRLRTPPSFMRAVSEGTDLSAQDTATAERQMATRQISVWIENAQNLTPEIQRLNALARARRIPIVTITETLAPARDSFEQWQVAQLARLASALHRVTGR
ncbi:MAG TPA: zinc ABC transporter substrate-binding protein [Solirubrobacteraceae bacterium]